MKITVLGPWGAYPKAGEATAGYLVEAGKVKFLLDCGSGVLAQLQKHVAVSDLSAVLISHHHHDHVADLGCLQYACLVETDLGERHTPLPIYAAGALADRYKSMKGSTVQAIDEESRYPIPDGGISFFATHHEAYCLGMRLEHEGKLLVYTADTTYHDDLIEHCQGADVLIAETSFYAEQDARPYGHMNTLDVAKLAIASGVKTLVLTHLPHFGEVNRLADEVRAAGYNGDIRLSETGLSIEL